MIGPAIKKYAKTRGLNITKDVAYGYIDGYLVTLIDGWDVKKASFSCTLTDEAIAFFDDMLSDKSCKKTYKIESYEIDKYGLSIIFFDIPGTMDKVVALVENLIGLFRKHAIPCGDVCPHCGEKIEPDDENRIVLNNEFAHRVHFNCACRMVALSELEELIRKDDKKSLILGIIGALLGAVVGSIPVVVAYCFELYFPFLCFFTGVGAKLGYDLFKGKIGAPKLITVFAMAPIGSALAIFLAYVVSFLVNVQTPGNPIVEAVLSFKYAITRLTPTGIAYLIDWGIAVFVAFLGAYIFLKKSNQDDKKKVVKVKILE